MNAFTTPSELMAAAKRLDIPLKWVGAKDEFELPRSSVCSCPSTLGRGQGYIINLQDSDDGPGTHWVCVYVQSIGTAAYFDSFGADIPYSILDVLLGAGIPKRKIYSSKKIIQDIEDGYCGQYCLYFIKKMSVSGMHSGHSKDLQARVKLFERIWYRDAAKNQKMIKNWSRMYLSPRNILGNIK
jgi:hypothetical protein